MKWKKLRDSYRDALKRQSEMLSREPSSQCKKNYPWKYTGQMQFLQPYMSNRKKPLESATSSRNGHAAAGVSDDSDSESGSERAQPPPPPPAPPPPSKLRRVGGTDRLGLIDRKLEYLCQQRGKRRRPSEPSPPSPPAPSPSPDPLDIFFNSMCQSTKRFPFQTQIKIKRSLFEAVMAAEEALLAEQQSYASLWARASASSEPDADPDADADVKPC